MRLQVFLSKAGISSRRSAATIIRSGKIHVNGINVLEPSFKIDPEKDKVFYNNTRIVPKEKVYVLLNKPKGVTTTKRDPFANKAVMDLLPPSLRYLNPVGRLDKDSSGLLLLTNDGKLLNKLTHPRFNIDKVYEVELDRKLASRDKTRLEKGINMDGKYTAPCKIKFKRSCNLEMTLHEGRKRQIKRMFRALGYKVMSLKRIQKGPLNLGSLPVGKWRFLTPKELKLTKLVLK